MENFEKEKILNRFNKLIDISLALSLEKKYYNLIEKILFGAKELTHSDGGTLYTRTEEDTLKFEIIQTDSLNLHKGGSANLPIDLLEVPLYDKRNAPNEKMVSAYSAVREKTVLIEDAYDVDTFDFSGTRLFDKMMGYRSKSFMTVPMKNHEGKVIGVLQLINALDDKTGEVISFSSDDVIFVESLASLAAVAMTKQNLIHNLNQMLESFVQAIADAIDKKSPHTGHHCRRVPILAMMLAQAVNDSKKGKFKKFFFSEDEFSELFFASWMHDCGKISIPTRLVEKKTKLETVFDRIELLDTRFEAMRRQEEVKFLKKKAEFTDPQSLRDLEESFGEKLKKWEEDRKFLHFCNQSKEKILSDEDLQRIERISHYQWVDIKGVSKPFLSLEEVENLSIKKGTLTNKEIEAMREHVALTNEMLSKIPYPKRIRRVSEIASSHHESLDGSGYPKKLKGEEISFQARILCIADIFEALTASERPYKKSMKLSEAYAILKRLGKEKKLDSDLLDLFFDSKVVFQYAKQYLSPEQIDL